MPDKHLPHLIVTKLPKTERFTSTSKGGGGPQLMPRDRQKHGAKLKKELRAAIDLPVAGEEGARPHGIYLEFRGEPGFDLVLKSLDLERSGIELVAVREVDETWIATVFVPDGKLQHYVKLVEAYLDPAKNTKGGKPKNRRLVESIAGIRRAALESFWTDAMEVFPRAGEKAWWEVWLRGAGEDGLAAFRAFAKAAGLATSTTSIRFPDRRVVLAGGTVEQMSESVYLLDCIAELRRAKETAREFLAMEPPEQAEWSKDLARRTSPAPADAPVVCVLDTGVNNTHGLLAASLPRKQMFAFGKAWGVTDHHGHGTEMAGLALYGDLVPVLASNGPVVLTHGLESVKILPPPPGQNAPDQYGAITLDAVGQVELEARERASLRKWDSKARYSLIVSIRSPEVETDIYTRIANSVAVTSAITV
jgi:hypothetical protein